MGTLRAEKIVVGYGGPPIVQDAAAWVESGQISVILGPNGAGKSTLAKAIIGLLKLSSGHIYLDGQDVTGLAPHQLVRLGVGYLPQLMNVFDEMTVLENLQMGALTYPGDFGKRLGEVSELFPDLPGIYKKKAGQLSGGQQRMVALARVLMVDPKVIILDEPTAGLSPLYATRVWEQIVRIRSHGVGLLVVEQNARTAMEHADYVFVMSDGRNYISGAASEIAGRGEVAAILVG